MPRYRDPETGNIYDSDTGQITPAPSPLQTFGQGAGRTMGRLGSGVQEVMSLATGFATEEGRAEREAIAQREQAAEEAFRVSRETNPTAAFLGESAPYMALPAAGRVLAPTAGLLAGGLTYTDEPGERALQAGLGAAGGVLSSNIGKVLRSTTPEARAAEAAGFKLTPGQRFGSRAMERLEASMESFPPTSRPFDRRLAANQTNINRVAAEAIGEEGDKVTGQMLDRARARIGDEFEEILSNQDFVLGDDFLDALEAAKQSEIGGIIKPEKDLDYTIDKFLDKMTEGSISGREYQKFRRQLQRTIDKNFNSPDGDREYALSLSTIGNKLDDIAEQQMVPDQLERFRNARQQWANLKILRNPRSVKIERGDVMPVSAASVAGRQDEFGYRLGRNQQPFYEAMRATNAMPRVVADSGTATRSFMQGLLGSGSPAQLTARTLGYGVGAPIASELYMASPELVRMLSMRGPLAASIPTAGLLGAER